MVRALAWTELLAISVIWFWPYLFRAPKVQKRKSITVRGPSLVGVLLQTAALFIVCLFRVPQWPRTSAPALIAALVIGLTADLLMWTAITHLGRQFRIQAGLYDDHQLVRTGPYAIVRHPIYASLLALTLSAGILLARWPWLIAGLALCIAGNEIRARTEDRLLESRFSNAFRDYGKNTPAYLPFIR